MKQYNSTWYFRAMYVQGRIFNWQQKKVCSSGYLVQWLSLKRSTSLQISSWSKQSYSALRSRFKNKALTEKKKKKGSGSIFQILCHLDFVNRHVTSSWILWQMTVGTIPQGKEIVATLQSQRSAGDRKL